MKILVVCLLFLMPASAGELRDITRRNLFRPLVDPAPKPSRVRVQLPVAPPPPPKIPLSQRVSHLKLVGIMDTEPRQAIIEDGRTQKTLYVSAGQSISDVEVENITNDTVLLAANDERFYLKM